MIRIILQRTAKDMLQVKVIMDRDENVLTSEESVLRGWQEYFEELMNEENEQERRVEELKLMRSHAT